MENNTRKIRNTRDTRKTRDTRDTRDTRKRRIGYSNRSRSSINNNIVKKQKQNQNQLSSMSSIPLLGSLSQSSNSNIKNHNDIQFSEENIKKMIYDLKEFYIDTNYDSDSNFDRIFKIFQKLQNNKNIENKFNLSLDTFNKKLIYPATLINIMSRLNNLSIANYKRKENVSDLYENYGSKNILNYVLTIFDTIGMKVLYVINNENKLYYSPLNDKKIRDIVRKNVHYTNFDNNYNEIINIANNKEKVFDASKYDIIFTSSGYHNFLINESNIEITLNNFDNKNYKSSILKNNLLYSTDKSGHIISISKCNNYNIVNTTWKPFNIYNIENFIPGDDKYYYINNNNNLTETNFECIEKKGLKYYTTKYIPTMDFYSSFSNIHLFSNRDTLKTKVYKNISGGGIDHINTIPEISVCSDIFFPSNDYGFCWFSSIINALFYSDEISSIFLNKSIRKMDKTLKYIKEHYDNNYEQFNQDDIKQLKIFFGHLINLFTFIYCSFNILSKNQLDDKITNKIKWYEIYNKIIEKYDMIYAFIIILSKTKID